MTVSAGLTELISRLEAAKTGAQGFDDAVFALAVKGWEVDFHVHGRPLILHPNCRCRGDHLEGRPHWKMFGIGQGGPSYTASLDAAVTLIPNGWILEHLGDVAIGPPGFMCSVGATAKVTSVVRSIHVQAATRPLSVVSASLKALLHTLPPDQG